MLYGDASEMDIAWNGSNLGVCWRDFRNHGNSGDIFCNLVDPDGSVLATDLLVGEGGPEVNDMMPSVAWSGSVFGVAWSARQPGSVGMGDILFNWVADDLSAAGTAQSVSNNPTRWNTMPQIVWAGSHWAVTYLETADFTLSDQYFVYLDQSGVHTTAPIRVTPVSTSDNTFFGNLAWTGSSLALVWTDGRFGPTNWELYFKLVDEDGADLTEELRVTNAPDDSWWVNIAWTGTEFGLAWQDQRSGDNRVYFQRIGFCE
jgi:hypothetical protein